MKPYQLIRTQRPTRRSAVTVLEVLFATMVVVVGLIGIATVLPFAARNAQEATAHTQALSMGLGWADSFFARGLHQPSPTIGQGKMNWLWYRDYDPSNTGGHGWENFIRGGYLINDDRNRVNVSQSRFESQSFSVGVGDYHRRIWGHLPVCIDPYFMTSESMLSRVATSNTRVGSYRASVFPYFNDRYDPVMDPFSLPSLTVDQPRMLRVGLAYGQVPVPPNPYQRGQLMSRSVISGIFGSVDDLAVDDSASIQSTEVDRQSRASSRIFSRDPSGTALKSLVEGRYTWMATVVPFEPQLSDVNDTFKADRYARQKAENALVSCVIMNRHSHEYVPALNNPLPGSTEGHPTGERMARVYPLSGNFTGGAGGRVRLIANDLVSSDLGVGDWMLLGRYFLLDGNTSSPSFTPRPYPFFRWYRVIATTGDAAFGGFQSLAPTTNANDPLSQNVWARDVVLEGPDFAFGATPTFATLVSGVVTVIERQVKLD